MALSKKLYLLAAVRAFEIAEVFYHTKHCDMHCLCHVVGLFDNHIDKLLCDVTITIPSTGRDWNTVRGTSPVPGGISTNR